MKLNLKYDERLEVNDSSILIPNVVMLSNSIKESSSLVLTGKNGTQLRLKVRRSPNDSTYVSRKTMFSLYNHEYKKTTLGCDPEFIILNSRGETVKSGDALGNTGTNKIGSDVSLAELRPDPGDTVEQVVENLRNLIKQVPFLMENKLGKNHGLTPKSYSEINNKCSGFHIHVGAPKNLWSRSSPGASTFLKSYATALDFLVAIPASILEESHLRRTGNGRYGNAGDIRTNGKYGTLEYRSCGGFHLRHPDYARGIMSLCKLSAENIINFVESSSCGFVHLPSVSEYDILRERFGLPEEKEIHRVYYSKYKRDAIEMLDGIVNVVCNFKGYEEHKDNIERFLELSVGNIVYSPNLLENW